MKKFGILLVVLIASCFLSSCEDFTASSSYSIDYSSLYAMVSGDSSSSPETSSENVSSSYQVSSDFTPSTPSKYVASSDVESSISQTVNNDKEDNKSTIVYITKTGEKYHRSGCRYLSRSKIAIELGDAKSQGYAPCSVCDPPQ